MTMSDDNVRDPSGVDPLQMPSGVRAIKWGSATFIVSLHVVVFVGAILALCDVVPSLFSFRALLMLVLGIVVFGWVGIGVCYHRLLTHRSFECPRWFERFLTMIAFCNLEGSSLWWISVHRRHHHHSDTRPDPHTPLVNFLWSHVGWLLFINPAIEGSEVYKNTKDLQKDPFHVRMHKGNLWLSVWLLHVAIIFSIGFAVGFMRNDVHEAYKEAVSFVVWGVFVRTVAFWNITWLVNSATHVWGYQNYKSGDEARNSWWVAILTGGEGWHNNHHHDQCSATVQHKWWEFDPSYYVIRLFELLGLVKNIKMPARNKIRAKDE
jgi:fatty-acid desaturase